MREPLRIDLEKIRYNTAKHTFVRGEINYENGAVFATIRRGNEIEGQCYGSHEKLFRVHATLDERGNVDESSCTCNYEYPGYCRHIIALLLTYLRKPELFEPLPSIADALAQCSREDLTRLIQQMIERHPDLQSVVDRYLPTAQQGGDGESAKPA